MARADELKVEIDVRVAELHTIAVTPPPTPPPFDVVNATDAELAAEAQRLDGDGDAIRDEQSRRAAAL